MERMTGKRMKLTGWKVFRNGELIFDYADIEMPDMVLRVPPLPDHHTLERLVRNAKLLATIPIKQ
jgi:hypothetical protein